MTTMPRIREPVLNMELNGLTRTGSDPHYQTARGRLQKQRSKLNDQINRELRMRAGAENLFKATVNKKHKDTIALELSFVNSSLQLLKEELAELNSSVEVYQNEESASSVPLIPLGLKETKDVDITTQFKDFILEHYSEEADQYEDSIQEFIEKRMAVRTPHRNESGVQFLYEYYNHLYYIDKRFFTQSRSHGIYFQWYDSLTGVPCSQRSVGFEKGSILFNISALYTQIAAKQDRLTSEGINAAIVNFEKAAGVMLYLKENFSHPPSNDMQPLSLEMLIQLQMSQAQECVFEKRVLGGVKTGVRSFIEVAQEAASVASMYQQTYNQMSDSRLKDYLPFTWISMVQVKSLHYSALSQYYTAMGILAKKDSDDEDELKKLAHGLYAPQVNNNNNNNNKTHSKRNIIEEDKVAVDDATCPLISAQGHLREALVHHEDALRYHNLCKQLRKIDTFQVILRYAHDRSLSKFSELEEEDDFSELLRVPCIQPKSEQNVEVILPDFSKHKVKDLFHKLGPLPIFNASCNWTAPRSITMQKAGEQGYGFSVRGGTPVIIADVETGSVAYKSGMKVGDFIVCVQNKDVKWSTHEEVVSMIKNAGTDLVIKIVTPINQKYLEAKAETINRLPSRMPMQTPTGSMISSKSTKSRKRLSWIFGRKDTIKDRIPDYSKDKSADIHL